MRLPLREGLSLDLKGLDTLLDGLVAACSSCKKVCHCSTQNPRIVQMRPDPTQLSITTTHAAAYTLVKGHLLR